MPRKGLRSSMANESKTPEEHLSDALDLIISPDSFNQELWWAVGTIANIEFTSQS